MITIKIKAHCSECADTEEYDVDLSNGEVDLSNGEIDQESLPIPDRWAWQTFLLPRRDPERRLYCFRCKKGVTE